MSREDDFDNWDQLIKNVEPLDVLHNVNFGELFNTSFMSRSTSFGTIDEMVQSSGFQLEEQADFEQNDAWDKFVAAHTQFPDWQEMYRIAVEEYYTQKLNEAIRS